MSSLESRIANLSPAQRELLSRQLARRKQAERDLAQIHPFPRTDNRVPLSFAQRRFWFLERLTPGNPVYNMSGVARVASSIQVPILERCFNEIIRRHETLRTTFTVVDGEPIGLLAPQQQISLQVIDLQGDSEAERQGHARDLIEQEARRPFDLTQGPLLRVTLLQLGKQEYLVQLALHHIVSDGWSTRVLFQEIGSLYWAYAAGKPSPLPELPFQYSDFAQWQRQWLQGERLNALLTSWKQQLADAPTALEMPTDRPRPPVQSFRGARKPLSLSSELVSELKALAHQQGATLFMTLLAAFQILLSRYTSQQDLLMGISIANRNYEGTDALIGVFVNTLVVRSDVSGDPTYLQALDRVRQVTLEAYAHQDLPFEMLVEDLHLDRDMSRSALVQTFFNFQADSTQAAQVPGLTMEDIGSGTAKFDLTLNLEEHGAVVSGHLEYSTDLFEAETIGRLLGHYLVLLNGIVAHPEQPISALPLLNERERHQLIEEWNATEAHYPNRCIHQLFEEQVQVRPEALAVRFEQEQLTYRELNQRANQLAHHLQKLGVGPEALVGVCMERSLEVVIALLGILKAGGACVPMDSSYPKERLAYMLNDAQVSIVLTQQHLQAKLSPCEAQCVCLDRDWATIAQEKTTNVITTTQLDNLAYILYTSGSTGRPKGVCIPHRGVIRLVKNTNYVNFTSDEIFLQFAPISFDASIFEIWGSLLNGALLVIFSAHLPSLDELATFLDRNHISILWLTAGLFHQMVERHAQTLGRIHQLLAGGDVLSVPHVQRMLEAMKQGTLINGYGPTESTTFTCCYPMKTLDDVGSSVSIGKPIANTSVYVLDKHLQPTPIGIPGELYIGGDGLARGYLNQPALTEERFIAHPFRTEPGARLYKTGDLVRYLPDGNIEFLGRLDHQVKLHGFRIEPGEIETVLKQHPQVCDAVVIVREDIPGDKRLVAYLVLGQSDPAIPADLRVFLKGRLPEYMVPASFVPLEAIPLSPNGKVDRRALPASQPARAEQERVVAAAQTETEQALVTLWQQLIGVEPIGIDDDFFEVGGHSLMAMKLIAQIQDTLHVEVPLPALFQRPTICEMAAFIDLLQTQGSVALEQLNPEFDLQAEAVLDSAIQRDPALPLTPVEQAHRLFFTGATGFLGAFLIDELLRQTAADLYCLVRASSLAEGRERLRENLQQYGLWHESLSQRLIPVLGDLAEPLFGLSPRAFADLAQTVEVIYHNGALVHFMLPYRTLKAPNVLGTQEVLRLASQGRIKPVHYVSSTYVFSRAEYDHDTLLREQDPPKHTTHYTLGYTQSKWVAEQLVLEAGRRGLPVSIYRIGRVGGHSQTGACQLNDLLWKFIQASILIQSAPQFDLTVELSPVDYISKALVHLSRQEAMQGKIFHIVNQQELRSTQLVEWMKPAGRQVSLEPYPQWCQRARRFAQQFPDSPVATLVPLLSGALPLDQLPNLQMDDYNTVEGLAGSGITCPAMDAQLMATYFSYFNSRGYFDTPATP